MIKSKRNFLSAMLGTAALVPTFKLPAPATVYDHLKCCWSWYETREILNARPLRKEGIVSRNEAPCTVLVDADGRDLLRLNPLAGKIWELCDGKTGVDGMVARITDRYEVSPPACAADVVSALTAFKRAGLISC